LHDIFADFSYWRLAGGTEVNFIINSMEIAIEAKATSKISGQHLKGFRSLKQDHPNVRRRIVVCLEDKPRITNDSIEIMPAREFAAKLWQGQIF